MPPTSLDARKTATRRAPPIWVPLSQRLYLQRELYAEAMERVRAGQYPSLAALIQFALHEHLTSLAEDEHRGTGRPPRLTERAKRLRDFLDHRADEILAAFETKPDRREFLTPPPVPSADDDLFALNPLLSFDEKAALETIGDWIPDLFADGNQPDEETPARVLYANRSADLSAAAGECGRQISHAKSSAGRASDVDDGPVRRRRTK